MAENKKHTFINYDPSNPRPTRPQRQVVSTYIGKHFRNRSAPLRRKASISATAQGQTPSNARGAALRILQPAGSQVSESQAHLLISVGGEERGLSSAQSGSNSLPLLRPVVECFVPDYPTEHRKRVFDVLDFHIHYLAARLTHWGTGPSPFLRCWVQMVCGDMTLFDSVAAFTHGVRITTLENQVAPSATMLWHKMRAIKGLQAKISADAEDRETTWRASETILATFYLREGAARFGYESEYKSHCLGLFRMMQLRGDIASGCLKDLYVIQAVGLVEGTEMASQLRNGVDSHDGESTSRDARAIATTGAGSTETELQYPHQVLHHDDPLWEKINAAPAGFHDLIMLGHLSTGFIRLLDELLRSIHREQLHRHSGMTEARERQTQMVKQARMLEKASNNVVERLACLGVSMFLTRRTARMQMFPETTLIDKLATLGRQMMFYDSAGTSSYNELMIWVTLVGVEIATTAGAVLKQRADQTAREFLFQERHIKSWDDVERIARRYLWDESSLPAWKEYWMSCKGI
ncbi:hypothetical protein FBEOM_6204 [Fusarium beomiforme]|uniref:Transcription factor n=1 Tax=Fusarium beomiforme TaxID=44412 RepID=A0A9P5AJI9_9HYPO|nr:hypothetical protein FBEOM_6204 [Fusarium beomiforme]